MRDTAATICIILAFICMLGQSAILVACWLGLTPAIIWFVLSTLTFLWITYEIRHTHLQN